MEIQYIEYNQLNITNQVEWEMTMITKGATGELFMGIFDKEHISELNVTSQASQTHAISFQLYSDNKPMRYVKGTSSIIDEEKLKYEENDKAKLKLDLRTRTARMYHNHRYLGTLTTGDLPDEMYLVASAYYDKCKYKTTRFVVTYL